MNNIKKLNIPNCMVGSNAADKCVYLVSSFKKNGEQVQVVNTKSAQMFTSNCVNS